MHKKRKESVFNERGKWRLKDSMGKGNVRYTEERASYCPQINMGYRSQTTREINKEKFLQNWRPKPPFENLHQMRKTVERMEKQQKSPMFWHTIRKTIKRKSWAVWRGGIRLFLKEYEATGWLATWGSLNKSELAAKNGLNSNVYFTTVRVHVCISFFFFKNEYLANKLINNFRLKGKQQQLVIPKGKQTLNRDFNALNSAVWLRSIRLGKVFTDANSERCHPGALSKQTLGLYASKDWYKFKL